jgi:hypothetical protein
MRGFKRFRHPFHHGAWWHPGQVNGGDGQARLSTRFRHAAETVGAASSIVPRGDSGVDAATRPARLRRGIRRSLPVFGPLRGNVARDFGGAPLANTYYAIATRTRCTGPTWVSKVTGRSVRGSSNPNIGTTVGLPGFRALFFLWDNLGSSTGKQSRSTVDFVPWCVHELGQGLGFLPFFNVETGALFLGRPRRIHAGCSSATAQIRRLPGDMDQPHNGQAASHLRSESSMARRYQTNAERRDSC